MSTTRPTPLPVKSTAPRYRRGVAPRQPGAANLSDSDSDSSADDVQKQSLRATGSGPKRDDAVVAGGAGRILNVGSSASATQVRRVGPGMKVALRDVKVEEDGGVRIGGKRGDEESSGEEETDDEEESEEEQKPVFTRPGQPKAKAASDESDEETGSEEESSEEEEEVPKKPVYRPTFVPKRARETVLAREAELQAEEELLKRKEEEAETRKKESRDLVGETIRREMAAHEITELIPDVDDTDDLDPTAEFDLWRLRELTRLARDKELALAREDERLEIERRKALPEDERMREDMEYVRMKEEEKREGRGENGFLDKFWHKGAFHQDEEILKRNFNVKLESSVDVSSLPKIMQVKNFGKMSRSKYTNLKDQDTTQEGWDRALKRGGPGGGMGGGKGEGCFNCGGPHLRRDCPNNNMSNGAGPSYSGQPSTGTNNSVLGTGSSSWTQGRGSNGHEESRRGSPREDREERAARDDYRSPRVNDSRDRERNTGREPREHDHSRGKERDRGDRDQRDRGDGDRYEERERRRSRSPRRDDRRGGDERRYESDRRR